MISLGVIGKIHGRDKSQVLWLAFITGLDLVLINLRPMGVRTSRNKWWEHQHSNHIVNLHHGLKIWESNHGDTRIETWGAGNDRIGAIRLEEALQDFSQSCQMVRFDIQCVSYFHIDKSSSLLTILMGYLVPLGLKIWKFHHQPCWHFISEQCSTSSQSYLITVPISSMEEWEQNFYHPCNRVILVRPSHFPSSNYYLCLVCIYSPHKTSISPWSYLALLILT